MSRTVRHSRRGVTRRSPGRQLEAATGAGLLEPLEPRLLLSSVPPGTPFTAEGLPLLHSHPDAPVTIYIDFQYESRDGQKLLYDWDGDPTSFNAREQDDIAFAWYKTASSFAPFDVDVTTEWPGSTKPFIWAAVYLTPSGPGSGGGARTFRYMPLSGYQSQRYDAVSGRVEDGLLAQSWIRQGAARGTAVITHEVGHSHGVSGHESADEEGTVVRIQELPIERGPFTRSAGPLGGWFNFTSEWTYQSNPAGMYWVVDDIRTLTTVISDAIQTYVDPAYSGDGHRPDEHASTLGAATAMTWDAGEGEWFGSGIIERWTDTDMLSFNWAGGTAWVGLQTALPVPLLDGRLVVYDTGGNIVGAADPTDSLQAALRLDDLPAGTYTVEVASDGDYTELGAYQLTVSAAEPQALETLAHLSFDAKSLTDASAAGNDGAWSGAPKWTTGQDGSWAARLNGSNRIEIFADDGNFIVEGANPLGRTFAFAFKADNAAAGTQVLFEDPTSPGYRIYLQNGRLKAYAINDAGLSNWRGGITLDSGVDVVSDQWYHVALTHRLSFSEVDDMIALFVNGAEVARGAAGPVPTTNRFYVGSTSFVGAIDDVHIYADVIPAHLIADFAGRTDLSGPAPTGTPMAVLATATHDTVQLTWGSVTGATGFALTRSVDNQHFEAIATIAAGQTQYDDTGLQGSRQYFYRLAALGTAQVGAVEVTTRPPGVHFTQYTKVHKDAAPDYTWSNKNYLWGHWSEGEYGIAVNFFGPDGHRDTQLRIDHSTDGVNFTPVITLPANESVYYDTNLQQGVTYTYRFVPIDEFGPVDSAAVIMATEPLNFKPDAVADTVLVDLGESVVVAVLGNDSDFDGDTLTIFSFTQGSRGTVTDNGNGTLTYTQDGVPGSSDSFRYTVIDGYGGFDSATVTVIINSGSSLGVFTTAQDIGNPGRTGATSYAGGEYTVLGGGNDIWYSSDKFHFVHRSETGDTEMIARVDAVQDTNDWAKAGVMFRNGTAANAAFAMVLQRPDRRVAFQWRSSAGGSATWNGSLAGGTSSVKYVKLVRQGNTFTGYYSTNGTSWTQVGSPQTISMSSTIQAGLAVTSHDNNVVAAVTFSHVSVGDNAAPEAVNDTLTTDQDTPLVIDVAADLLDNDNDDDGDPLSLDSFTQPPHGLVTDNEDDTLTYTPDPGYFGLDGFTYTVSDGQGGTGGATVTVVVKEVLPPPPPPTVTAVSVNNQSDKGVSSISAGPFGVLSIAVSFDERVIFTAGDVTVQTVTFPGGVETPGETITPSSVSGSATYQMMIYLPIGPATQGTWVKVALDGDSVHNAAGIMLDGDAPGDGSGRGYLFDATDLPSGDGTPGGDAVFYVGSLAADATGDGTTDNSDLAVLLANWESGPAIFSSPSMGDFTGNGDIDDNDLAVLLGNWEAALDALPSPAGASESNLVLPAGLGADEPTPAAGDQLPGAPPATATVLTGTSTAVASTAATGIPRGRRPRNPYGPPAKSARPAGGGDGPLERIFGDFEINPLQQWWQR